MGQHPIDDAGAGKADHNRQTPGHLGGLEAADVLKSPEVALDVPAGGRQRIEDLAGAPAQVDP